MPTFYIFVQDEEYLYFIFENCPNGTLNDIIGAKGKLTEEIVKIYAA
jgi:serine/threonine protein kinase